MLTLQCKRKYTNFAKQKLKALLFNENLCVHYIPDSKAQKHLLGPAFPGKYIEKQSGECS